ncbi:hypothetical protein RFEPED_0091 [Rickettsia felis str. Pedreira]|uniref:Uncharacterized protein n=1 Tax=Rickettsia felis str. Pedreira TaxID=1359196 RepID=A0A0F3MPQ7_RICFI|nr:hypothetical protein RFEPED_0091 [Rickettsia felis str. Pedreira]
MFVCRESAVGTYVPKAKGVAVTIQDGKTVALTRKKALADEAKLFPVLIVKIIKPIIFRRILKLFFIILIKIINIYY